MAPFQAAGSLDPLRVFGRRWHSLEKGFPGGTHPDWPLELVDRMLRLLEPVAGDDSLAFDAPDRVGVKPNGAQQTWAEELVYDSLSTISDLAQVS